MERRGPTARDPAGSRDSDRVMICWTDAGPHVVSALRAGRQAAACGHRRARFERQPDRRRRWPSAVRSSDRLTPSWQGDHAVHEEAPVAARHRQVSGVGLGPRWGR